MGEAGIYRDPYVLFPDSCGATALAPIPRWFCVEVVHSEVPSIKDKKW